MYENKLSKTRVKLWFVVFFQLSQILAFLEEIRKASRCFKHSFLIEKYGSLLPFIREKKKVRGDC